MTYRLRPALVFWHRWFGLLAALWLALMGLTGSIIVFYDELDSALNPDLRRAEAIGERRPASEIVAAAVARHPGSYASFVDLPNKPHETAAVILAPRGDLSLGFSHRTYVFVDPYAGEVRGERVLGAMKIDRRHVMDFLYQLHLDLHLGGWMLWFLGLVAFLWVFDHISAAVLSFPTLKKWAQSFRIRAANGHKLVFDLHRAGGLWLFPVTFVIAVSGVYFNWYDEVTHAVEAVSPLTPRYHTTLPESSAPDYAPPVSIDEAIEKARARANADVDVITIIPGKGVYEARAFDARDIDMYGRRMITVDARSGEIVSDFHATSGSAGDVALVWQYPLHSGKAFGWPGRIVIFISGLAVAGLSVTGVLIWHRKRKARLSLNGRSTGPVAP